MNTGSRQKNSMWQIYLLLGLILFLIFVEIWFIHGLVHSQKNSLVYWFFELLPLLISLTVIVYLAHRLVTLIDELTHSESLYRKKLHEERGLSQAVLDSSGVMIVVVDVDGHIRHFNRQSEETSFYSAEEAIGRLVWEVLFDPGDEARIREIFAEVCAEKGSGWYNLWITTKSQERRLIEWSSARVFDDEGKLSSLVGIGIDITEKELMFERLRSSEQWLARAQKISNTGNWVWDITDNTLQWSDQIYRIFGVEQKAQAVTYDDFLNAVHPDDREQVTAAVLNSVADSDVPYSILHRIVRPEGQIRYVQEVGEVIRDSEGNALQMMGTVQDRTEYHNIESELNTIFNLSPDVVGYGNLSGKFIKVNNALHNILGYSNNEFLRRSFMDFVHPDDEERTAHEIAMARGGKADIYIENRYRCKDGQYKWLAWSVVADASNNAFLAIGRDITTRIQAEDELKRAKSLLDSIVENVPNMIFLKRASDLRFEFFNRAGENLLGIDRSLLLGKNDYDLFPREQADFFTGKDRQVLDSDGVMDIDQESIDTPKGTRILHTQKITLRDENQVPQYLLGISEDITDRLAADKNLRQLKYTLDQVMDCVFMFDAETLSFFYVNEGAVQQVGYTHVELMGMHPYDIKLEYNEAKFRELIRPLIEGREVAIDFETTHQHRQGKVIPVNILLQYIQWEENPPHFIAIVRDIRERRQTEDAMKKSLAEKEVLIRELHHRVKNILQVISSLITMQSRQITDEKSKMAFVETRDRIRAVALIYEKLFGESNLSEVDVKQYVQYIASRLDSAYGIGKRGIDTRIKGSQIVLTMEKALPCGLIANELLTNAYKHGFPEGKSGAVEVEFSRDSDQVCSMHVHDDGIGMKQAASSADSFGLDIVHTLVEQLDGTITISSNGGTSIELTFPG